MYYEKVERYPMLTYICLIHPVLYTTRRVETSSFCLTDNMEIFNASVDCVYRFEERFTDA